MKKILFGITGLTLGGAERVLVDLCNRLCHDFDITIFALYGKGEFESELNKKVHLVSYQNQRWNELSKKEKLNITFPSIF